MNNKRSDTLVYYNYSGKGKKQGDGRKITIDIKNKSAKAIKKELKKWEDN
ncbi:hypothetical protein [Leptotrichia sp. OH3620_COT-345]|nr:hypothetical protein [Leptotrichia sp. OH3620_COT-345]